MANSSSSTTGSEKPNACTSVTESRKNPNERLMLTCSASESTCRLPSARSVRSALCMTSAANSHSPTLISARSSRRHVGRMEHRQHGRLRQKQQEQPVERLLPPAPARPQQVHHIIEHAGADGRVLRRLLEQHLPEDGAGKRIVRVAPGDRRRGRERPARTARYPRRCTRAPAAARQKNVSISPGKARLPMYCKKPVPLCAARAPAAAVAHTSILDAYYRNTRVSKSSDLPPAARVFL